jgi:hypothetical protein
MPRQDAIVRQSEALVLRYNPQWTGADWNGVVPEQPERSRGVAAVRARLCYDEAIWFTREEWRGPDARAARDRRVTVTRAG